MGRHAAAEPPAEPAAESPAERSDTDTDTVAAALPSAAVRSGWAVALGVVLALVFGGTVWAAIARNDPPPAALIIVRPSASLSGPPAGIDGAGQGLGGEPTVSPVPSAATPLPAVAPSATASPAPSPSGTPPATTSARPQPTRTRPPSTGPTSGPPATAGVTARYTLSSTWDRGFVANVEVAHQTAGDQTFAVRLTFPDNVLITVTGYWNATPTASGADLTFSGQVGPAGTLNFGFQAEKDRPAQVDPVGCTVNGRACVGF